MIDLLLHDWLSNFGEEYKTLNFCVPCLQTELSYLELHNAHSLTPPSEEFELTANSLEANIETHNGLILRTLSHLTVNSQDVHCELPVSFP